MTPSPEGEAKGAPGCHQRPNHRKEQIVLHCGGKIPTELLSEAAELRQNILPHAIPESVHGTLHSTRHRLDHQTGANLRSDLTVFAAATSITDDCHDGVGKTYPVVGVLIVPASQHMVSASHRTSRDVKESLAQYMSAIATPLRVYLTL